MSSFGAARRGTFAARSQVDTGRPRSTRPRKAGWGAWKAPMETITAELLRRFDVPGPRYTSYPTADRFVEAFGPADYEQALAQRRDGPAALALPLSLYVHVPF